MAKPVKSPKPLAAPIEPEESELARSIRLDGEKRRAACLADIQAALERHRCAIGISPRVQIEGQNLQVILTPLPPK